MRFATDGILYLYTIPVWYTCMVYLYGIPVWYTIPVSSPYLSVEYGIFGEGSQILTNQNREGTGFSLLTD